MNENPDAIMSVQERIMQFFQSFDRKDWGIMRECLADELNVDYSSFRGSPPGRMTADEFVNSRKQGLKDLTTEHLARNLRITFDESGSNCYCDFEIHRHNVEQRYYNSYGHYTFVLIKTGAAWKISGIKQMVTGNEGDKSIHGAFK